MEGGRSAPFFRWANGVGQGTVRRINLFATPIP